MSATASAALTLTEPPRVLSEAEIEKLAQEFLETGSLIVRNVISREMCGRIRDEIDRIFREVPENDPTQSYGPFLRTRLFEYSELIAAHLDYAPIIDLAEKILGKQCHLVSNNVVRNDRKHAISTWHADEEVMFPLPEGVDWPEGATPPCHCFNSQWYLTDVSTDDGPTEVVPYSHRSGKNPPHNVEAPEYKGHKVQQVIVKAGDVCLQHSQVWHRGAPVKSDKTRYMMQYSYGRRSFAQRLFPFVNYQIPKHVEAAATPRQLRVLGKHSKGPWG